MGVSRLACVALIATGLACQPATGDRGRMALGLTGQFLPGELTTAPPTSLAGRRSSRPGRESSCARTGRAPKVGSEVIVSVPVPRAATRSPGWKRRHRVGPMGGVGDSAMNAPGRGP